MCDPVTLMVIATGISAGSSIMQGQQAKQMADKQAEQATLEGMYRMDAAKSQAEKIRKAGKFQQGEAKASLAASGVKLGDGTPLEIQRTITQNVEQDALTAILNGQRAQSSANTEAELLHQSGRNAQMNGVLNAGSTVLSAGADYKRGGWKTRG